MTDEKCTESGKRSVPWGGAVRDANESSAGWKGGVAEGAKKPRMNAQHMSGDHQAGACFGSVRTAPFVGDVSSFDEPTTLVIQTVQLSRA